MKLFLDIVILIWIIVLLLFVVLLRNYSICNAESISCENCKINFEEGFVYLKYEKDNKQIYGKAKTISHIRLGKKYKVLATKKGDERIILLLDVVKLSLSLFILTAILILLSILKIGIWTI